MNTIEEHLIDITGKINKLRPLGVGDRVIHKSTGNCGTVTAVESYSRTEGQMVSVELLNGKKMRGIPRMEFGLHTPSIAQIRVQSFQPTVTTKMQEAISVKLDGPISNISILDELC